MTLTPIKSWIIQTLRTHKEFSDALVKITFHRIFYLSVISAPVSLAHVLILSWLSFDTEAEQQWRIGIIICHSLISIISGAIAWVTRPAGQEGLTLPVRRRICQLSHATMLISGVIITSVDQLVTPAVTPFLIACMLAGILYIVNPLPAFALYLTLFFAYLFALSITQTNDVVLLSNIVNGLTACSIAAGLSWLLWQQNIRSLQQQNIIQQQQQKLELNNHQLGQLATRDYLTGLANRRMLEMLATEEHALMKRRGGSACLLLLDMDHFKNINDVYGHPAGDQILRQLAALLTEAVRASDRVARWGGEEFGILLRDTEPAQALQVGENIRATIEQHQFTLMDQSGSAITVQMTASIGMAQLDAAEADMLGETYRRADIALYAAKNAGRNQVVGRAL